MSAFPPKAEPTSDLRTTPAASYLRTPPSSPRASPHSRAWGVRFLVDITPCQDQQQQPQALANADHGKAAYATLLPKPDLPKPVSHKASAVANRLLSRERGCGRRQLCCGLTVDNSVVLPRTARPSNPLGYNAGAGRASHAIDGHNRPWPPPIRDRQCVFLHEQR